MNLSEKFIRVFVIVERFRCVSFKRLSQPADDRKRELLRIDISVTIECAGRGLTDRMTVTQSKNPVSDVRVFLGRRCRPTVTKPLS